MKGGAKGLEVDIHSEDGRICGRTCPLLILDQKTKTTSGDILWSLYDYGRQG